MNNITSSNPVLNRSKIVLAILLFSFLLFLPATAFAQGEGSGSYELTSGRVWSLAAVAVGLISAIFAGVFLFRSTKKSVKRGYFIATATAGAAVILYALIHLNVLFTGDLGTGDGKAGALFAMMLGVVTIILSAISLARTRR